MDSHKRRKITEDKSERYKSQQDNMKTAEKIDENQLEIEEQQDNYDSIIQGAPMVPNQYEERIKQNSLKMRARNRATERMAGLIDIFFKLLITVVFIVLAINYKRYALDFQKQIDQFKNTLSKSDVNSQDFKSFAFLFDFLVPYMYIIIVVEIFVTVAVFFAYNLSEKLRKMKQQYRLQQARNEDVEDIQEKLDSLQLKFIVISAVQQISHSVVIIVWMIICFFVKYHDFGLNQAQNVIITHNQKFKVIQETSEEDLLIIPSLVVLNLLGNFVSFMFSHNSAIKEYMDRRSTYDPHS